jgi:hypothetical protein
MHCTDIRSLASWVQRKSSWRSEQRWPFRSNRTETLTCTGVLWSWPTRFLSVPSTILTISLWLNCWRVSSGPPIRHLHGQFSHL